LQKRLQHRHKVPAAVAEYFPLKNPAYVYICNSRVTSSLSCF
jgi:hypothetical protein